MSALRNLLKIVPCSLLLLSLAEGAAGAGARNGTDSCMTKWLTLAGINKSSVRAYEPSLRAMGLDESNHQHPLRRSVLPFLFHRHPGDAKKFIPCFELRKAKCRHTPPCGIGGKCLLDVKKSYYCKCKVGMAGEFCAKELDGCASDPCQHGAQCIDSLGRYQCTCQPGFEGQRCEKRWLSRGIFKALPQQVADLTTAVKSLNSSLSSAVNSLTSSIKMLTSNTNKKIERFAQVLKTQSANLTQLKKKTERLAFLHTSCQDFYKNGFTHDGKYVIWRGKSTMHVWCDMTTDGGGWTVIQRRKDGSVDFFRNWNNYKNGFGDVSGEFWLGNDRIYHLTLGSCHKLRIDFNGGKYAKYSQFAVAGEGANYRLTVSGFSGNVKDGLAYHNNCSFSTKDKDNDNIEWNCATEYSGARWYNGCHHSCLNGIYGKQSDKGVTWLGISYPSFVEMKIR